MMHGYRNLGDYLRARCAAFNISMRELSRTLSFSPNYIEAIANGHFNPSRKRCLKIAQYFNDDPNIILEFSGLYVPPPSDNPLHQSLINMIANLPQPELRQLVNMARLLKLQADQRMLTACSAAYDVRSPIEDLRKLLDQLPADVAPTAHDLLGQILAQR